MFGCEKSANSQFNRKNNKNTQFSCSTTTLIKYRVNNYVNVEVGEENESRRPTPITITPRVHPRPRPREGGGAGPPVNNYETTTATAKTTTTTTFGHQHQQRDKREKGDNQQDKQYQFGTAKVSPSDKESGSSDKDRQGGGPRPPFVTTVTRGKFLPSKFDLLVEKCASASLFSFSSRPRPVHLIKKHRCWATPTPTPSSSVTMETPNPTPTPTASRSTRNESALSCPPPLSSPRGAHDYYNVMWDPHVVRGTTAGANNGGTRSTGVNDLSTSSQSQLKSTLTEARQNEAGKFPRIKRVVKPPQDAGVRFKSRSHAFSNSVSPLPRIPAGSRGCGRGRGRFGTTTPPPPRTTCSMIQTDTFLEELPADDGGSHSLVDQFVQTEPIHDTSPNLNSHTHTHTARVQAKSGIDSATQILPGELFYFDDEVAPVLESLVGKILEQAMYETVEEEELAAIREEKNRWHEQRRREEKELHELQKEHERISVQKEQLKRRLDDERASSEGRAYAHTSSRSSSVLSAAATTTGAGTTVYTTSYLLELLPSVLNSLRQEGFLDDERDDDGDGDGDDVVPEEDGFSRPVSPAAAELQRSDSCSSPRSPPPEPISTSTDKEENGQTEEMDKEEVEEDPTEEEYKEEEGEGQMEGKGQTEEDGQMEERDLDTDINAISTIQETQAEISHIYENEMSTNTQAGGEVRTSTKFVDLIRDGDAEFPENAGDEGGEVDKNGDAASEEDAKEVDADGDIDHDGEGLQKDEHPEKEESERDEVSQSAPESETATTTHEAPVQQQLSGGSDGSGGSDNENANDNDDAESSTATTTTTTMSTIMNQLSEDPPSAFTFALDE